MIIDHPVIALYIIIRLGNSYYKIIIMIIKLKYL